MKDTKLYKVEIGYQDRKAGDVQNWMNRNVIARDALGAIRKVKLSKREYIVAVTMSSVVDIQ